jgi:hypothetical protein
MTTPPIDCSETGQNIDFHKIIPHHGPGIPDIHDYLTETRRIVQYLSEGKFRVALNRSRSMFTNIWNFQVHALAQNVECPICGWQGLAFLSAGNWRSVQHNSRCPNCGSKSRHRGLTLLLPDLIKNIPEGPALIFAPEYSLMPLVRQLTSNQVRTTDYLRTDVDFPGEDIQNLSFADHTFAFLMCNHVLEHIPDDRQALLECARVLKPGGVAVFTIPGDFPKQETWHFEKPDETGHLRHYGLDVIQKMAPGFNRVDVVDMGLDKDPRWCIRRNDLAFICRK